MLWLKVTNFEAQKWFFAIKIAKMAIKIIFKRNNEMENVRKWLVERLLRFYGPLTTAKHTMNKNVWVRYIISFFIILQLSVWRYPYFFLMYIYYYYGTIWHINHKFLKIRGSRESVQDSTSTLSMTQFLV